ncbi:MAG: hypothetical protein Q9174_003429 [Haloplaca sp. 1 TL-2023]
MLSLRTDRDRLKKVCQEVLTTLEEQDTSEDSASESTDEATEPPRDTTNEIALPILPAAVLDDIVDGDYDPSWMTVHNIPDHYLEGWSSKKGLVNMLIHGALELGDVFSFKFVDNNGALVDRQVKVSNQPTASQQAAPPESQYIPTNLFTDMDLSCKLLSTDSKGNFDVDIYNPVIGTTTGAIQTCSGLRDVVNHLHTSYGGERYNGSQVVNYEECQVYHHNLGVGNLNEVRQKFTLREVLRLRKAGKSTAFSNVSVKGGKRAGNTGDGSASGGNKRRRL